MARLRSPGTKGGPIRRSREPVLGVSPGAPAAERILAARERNRASAAASAGRWLALAFVASALIHAGVTVALLFWPVRDPIEEPGEIGSVALVFDDQSADAGAGAMDGAATPAPPAPPAVPPPPAPAAEAQAVPPPPPVPPPPAAAAPPSPPATPEAPRDVAALPPDPAGILPPPPAPVFEPEAPPPTPPVEAPEPPREMPPPLQAEPAREPSPRQEAAERQPDPLPLPPLPPPVPQQQAAAVQPAPPPRPPSRPAAAQGPVRLNAGDGSQPDAHLGSFALGAVMPPGADAGHRNNPPDYPAEARRRGEEGVVRLSLRIGPDGQVTAAEVETSSGFPALDRAAVEAARRWRFRPATRAGTPVAATLPTAVHFRLSDARGR